MPEHRVVIHPDGTTEEIELTAAEEAERLATAAATNARRDALVRSLDTIAAAGPSAALVAKVRAGQQLTAIEQAGLVRWLTLLQIGAEPS